MSIEVHELLVFPGPDGAATGAAAVALVGKLGRRVEIHQGVGSVLTAGPTGDGAVEPGGRVAAVRQFALSESGR